MAEFIHISDIHFNSDYSGSQIVCLNEKTGLTLTEQFILNMERINKRHPDVDFYLLTGDLVHDGTADEYAELRCLIDKLTGGKPCYFCPGNHDTESFCDYEIIEKSSGLKIIALDSRGGPYGSGVLSDTQLRSLREKLSDKKPAVLLLHHTPHIGDTEYLIYQTQNPAEIYEAVRGSGLLGIFTGHTHIRFETMLGEIPCHTAPSITFKMETDESSVTITDDTGYNYCIYADGKLAVENIELPGTSVSLSFSYDELY